MAPTVTKLNKQEAIRRLIHAAIRMLMAEEDPFAIHLLIQSADKTLIDVTKKLGKELRIDWELHIKDEYHKQFFEKHRAVYNYLKHGNKDVDDELTVEDIFIRNLMDLYVIIGNYNSTFSHKTNHMVLFQVFVLQLYPGLIIPPESLKQSIAQSIADNTHMTPRRFFELAQQHNSALPDLFKERLADLDILGDFYSLTFNETRSGVKANPRKRTLPGI